LYLPFPSKVGRIIGSVNHSRGKGKDDSYGNPSFSPMAEKEYMNFLENK
jgi:hypothetical protein